MRALAALLLLLTGCSAPTVCDRAAQLLDMEARRHPDERGVSFARRVARFHSLHLAGVQPPAGCAARFRQAAELAAFYTSVPAPGVLRGVKVTGPASGRRVLRLIADAEAVAEPVDLSRRILFFGHPDCAPSSRAKRALEADAELRALTLFVAKDGPLSALRKEGFALLPEPWPQLPPGTGTPAILFVREGKVLWRQHGWPPGGALASLRKGLKLVQFDGVFGSL